MSRPKIDWNVAGYEDDLAQTLKEHGYKAGKNRVQSLLAFAENANRAADYTGNKQSIVYCLANPGDRVRLITDFNNQMGDGAESAAKAKRYNPAMRSYMSYQGGCRR